MLMSPASPTSSMQAGEAPIHQMFITHCLRGEGVYKPAGFTIRASSTLDPLLVRFALEYPFYELPVGFAAATVEANPGPARLALVRIPGGQSALIHSVYLPEEERGRTNNFFSHILIRAGLTARQALTSWGSPQWRMTCHPEMGTEIPPLDALPIADLLNDQVVTSFLSDAADGWGEEARKLRLPARLAGEPRLRRELVGLALRGCLLALQASPSAPRCRFYILAEPELTALLLYATCRLLPEAMAANLTFSTYENAHRDLRVYRHARIVGTCLADPARGLEAEFFTTRGYALDTFAHQYSAELSLDTENTLDEWIDLAARGDWATVDKVQRTMGKNAGTVMPIKEGLQAAKINRRVLAGECTAEDLLALKKAPWGADVLEEQKGKLWPIVRDCAVSNERVREAYSDLLQARLPEAEKQTKTALACIPPGDWQSPWRYLCTILQDDATKLRETLQRVLPPPPYTPELQLALLREMPRSLLSPSDAKSPAHGLLKNCTTDSLNELARSDTPREWLALALLYSFAKVETRPAAVRHLHEGSDELVWVFWEQFRLLKDDGQQRAILSYLFPADRPEGLRFLDRVLTLRIPLRAASMDWLLTTFDPLRPEPSEFWRRDNHLGLMLDLLRTLGQDAASLWDRLSKKIDATFLVVGDSFQSTLLLELAALKNRSGPALLPRTVQTIEDWLLLHEHFEKAIDVPESMRRAILDACARLGLDPCDALRPYFERYILPQGDNKVVLDDFAGFFHSFFLAGMEYHNYSARLICWLQILSGCKDQTLLAAYQLYYLENQVPLEFRVRLAEEMHKACRLVSFVVEKMRSPVRVAEPKPEPLVETRVAEAPNEDWYQLSAVYLGEPASFGTTLVQRGVWLVFCLLGGLLGAYLLHLYRIQLQRFAALTLFLPLLLLLTESMVLQSLALSVKLARRSKETAATLRRQLTREFLTALLLSVGCGAVVTVATVLWTGTWSLALTLGVSLADAMTVAAATGCVLPFALRHLPQSEKLSAGLIARIIAALSALFLFLGISCLLLR